MRPPASTEDAHLSGGSQRKANGVYYTPARLAQLLAGWALDHVPQRILEPAFGDGAFLHAAHDTLLNKDVANAPMRLHGIELDPAAVAHVHKSSLRPAAAQLLQGDLLAFDPGRLGGTFDAILGNPPYIRHHLLSEELIERGRTSASRLGIDLNGRSDAWAYFCAHLVTFLAPGGRLALVLPGSVLQADYAVPLLNALAADKGEVQLIRIGERLFPGVQERTVVLLIDRGSSSGGRVIYRRIADLPGLRRALRNGSKGRPSAEASRGHRGARLPWRLTSAEAAAWEEICASELVSRLGELAKIRIGVVTGANGFFIRTEPEAKTLGKAIGTVPIVSRSAWLDRPRWSAAAQAAAANQRSRLLLFPNGEGGLSAAARAELRRAEKQGIHERSHCAKRSPWYTITDAKVPHLFLPYMGSGPRRLITNDAQATCSNAIHRVWLLPDTVLTTEAIAAGSWTTLYRLSAELQGRSYGGGVLKLEPGSGATGLRLPAVESTGLLQKIEVALKNEGPEAAEHLADRELLMEQLEITEADVDSLRKAAAKLEALRAR